MAVAFARPIVTAALLAIALSTGACRADASEGLRLVHADEFSIVFMDEVRSGRAHSGTPIEMETWTFFDEPDRPGRGPGWNTRISRIRIDCDAAMLASLNHQVFMDETLVDEVVPPYRMHAPIGPEEASVLAWACDLDRTPLDTVVRDLSAARLWANAAWPTLRTRR